MNQEYIEKKVVENGKNDSVTTESVFMIDKWTESKSSVNFKKSQERKNQIDQKSLHDYVKTIFSHHLYYADLGKILVDISAIQFDAEIASTSIALQKLFEETLEFAKKSQCYKIITNCNDTIKPLWEKYGFGRYENSMRVLDL